jgi:hypothetical protein
MSSADEPLVLQALGHVAVGDAAGEALDDGGLADARLADEHRVVLGAAAEHLDDAADLVVAADDRVDLAVAGAGGEVLPVLLQRGEVLLRVLAGDAVAAAHLLQRLQQLFAADAEPLRSSPAAGARPTGSRPSGPSGTARAFCTTLSSSRFMRGSCPP